MRFFIDQCVPESVAKAIERNNHEAVRLREKIAPDSPDTLVAAVAESNDAILVTMDGDFKKLASQYGVGHRRFRRLSLLKFSRCRESDAARRTDEAMSLIEHEWKIVNHKRPGNRRMFVEISNSTIRTHR